MIFIMPQMLNNIPRFIWVNVLTTVNKTEWVEKATVKKMKSNYPLKNSDERQGEMQSTILDNLSSEITLLSNSYSKTNSTNAYILRIQLKRTQQSIH